GKFSRLSPSPLSHRTAHRTGRSDIPSEYPDRNNSYGRILKVFAAYIPMPNRHAVRIRLPEYSELVKIPVEQYRRDKYSHSVIFLNRDRFYMRKTSLILF